MYQNGEEPVRIDHYVNTFPQFRLGSSTDLIQDLELTATSRIDLWQGEWITISIETVITIEKAQRVLLRLRPNLLKPLQDCPGIEGEIALQLSRRPVGNKRASNSFVSPVKKVARRTEGITSTRHIAQSPPTSPLMSPAPFPLLAPTSKPAPSLPPSARPSKPLPRRREARKWPHDFYVSEIEAGFGALNKRLKKKELEKEAFPKVFGGSKYVKMTVWKYKAFWKNADRKDREKFIALGHCKEGLFSRFIDTERGADNVETSDDESLSHMPSTPPKTTLSIPPTTASLPPTTASLPPTTALDPSLEDDTIHADDDGDDSSSIEDLYYDGPRVYCPFCDQLMEKAQSPKLVAMRVALEEKTWPDPSTEYPGHRSATSFTVYSLFCEQHRFEAEHLPRAIRKGWPLEINFHTLYDRIRRLRPELEEIMEEPSESHYFEIAKKRYRVAANWTRFTNGGAG